MTLIPRKLPKELNAGGIAALEELRASINHVADALVVLPAAVRQQHETTLVEMWCDVAAYISKNQKFQSKKAGKK